MTVDIEQTYQFIDRLTDFVNTNDNPKVYQGNSPFPHIVIDNLFNEAVLHKLIKEMPASSDPLWHVTENHGIQVKLRSNFNSERQMGDTTRAVFNMMNSGEFMQVLSQLTGIDQLISDPYFTGGGFNQSLPGGHLAIHCDGNWHDQMGVHRRLNVILYLNDEWQDAWGGHLELWDKDLTECVKKITPAFNRLMIFTTHDYTYHGHPTPLACPADESRKSLIFYYYTTASRPAEQINSDEKTLDGFVHRASWKQPETAT